MSKAVLISVRPEWCEKIASGEKTIEVRKTRPKMPTPFKCCIYCTNPRHYVDSRHWLSYPAEPLWITANKDVKSNQERGDGDCILLNGKVIGEFVCDRIDTVEVNSTLSEHQRLQKETCLSELELVEYLSGAVGYAWHISELKIYDTPKELSDFIRPKNCGYGYDCETCKPVHPCSTRPPQSWCYVEELE